MHFHSSPPQRSQRLPPELKKPLFQIIPDKFVLEPYQSQMVTLQGSSPVYVYAALFPGPAHLYTAENGTGLGMRLVDTHINIVIAETGSLCTLSTMTHCVLSNRSSSISLFPYSSPPIPHSFPSSSPSSLISLPHSSPFPAPRLSANVCSAMRSLAGTHTRRGSCQWTSPPGSLHPCSCSVHRKCSSVYNRWNELT